MSEPSHDDEQFERIPWDHLSSAPPSRGMVANWRLAAYGLAGAVAVAAITASLVSGANPASVPTTTIPTVTTATPIATTVSSPSTTTSTLVTEADLIAVPAGVVSAEAAAWAEVLTEAYLATDGSGSSAFASYLPPNSSLPVPAATQRVFVESVRAISANEESPGLFRVVVRASVLSALGSEEYRRLPVRALAWTLRWDRDGWRLVDLPEQVDPPILQPAGLFEIAELPEVIRSAASADGTVLAGGPVGDLWRVVIAVSDPLGGSWPVVKWFSPDGVPVGGSTASG